MPLTSLSSAQGFQSFTDPTSNVMVATATAGTPAAGTFYSSIINRSSMPDLRLDLKPRMGIERIMIQQFQLLQNEVGPAGELVYGGVNDQFNQIRFVGGGWIVANSASGNACYTSSQNDYIEVTFYGTGLNYVTQTDTNSRDNRYALDGGSYSANVYPPSSQGALNNRLYSMNVIVPIVANLALGVHTIQLKNNLAANGLTIFGIEVLNDTTVRVNPGQNYINGQKLALAAQSSFAHSAPVTGARGGRVLVYQASDGTIGQSFQAVNAASATLTSADHTNEEVARVYNWREFGTSRTDDFNSVGSASATVAFTLEDGSVSLVGSNVAFATGSNAEVLGLQNNGSFILINFIGTGLDIVEQDGANGGADTYNFQVDGGATVTFATTGSTIARVVKLVSGLPYGTHCVRINRVTATTYAVGVKRFIVYQPKKPTLPAGAVELADYNVLANFVATGSVGTDNIATGVMRKAASREMSYNGTGWSTTFGIFTNHPTGNRGITSTNTDFVEYTFFGTGFDLRNSTGGTDSATVTVSLQNLSTGGTLQTLNSTNFPGLTTGNYGNIVFTYASGNLNTSGTATNGNGAYVSGLTLGYYKVRFTNGTANNLQISCIDIITPIHSFKSSLYADLQNALPVGSQGISDNRALTPVKDIVPATKSWAQAVGVGSNPTLTSTSYIPMPDMSLTVKTTGGALQISFAASVYNNGASQYVLVAIAVNGILQPVIFRQRQDGGGTQIVDTIGGVMIVPLAAGTHKIDALWSVSGGTGSVLNAERILSAREL